MTASTKAICFIIIILCQTFISHCAIIPTSTVQNQATSTNASNNLSTSQTSNTTTSSPLSFNIATINDKQSALL